MREITKNKQRVMSEKETIQNILSQARTQGVEDKVMGLIQKYQDLVKGARSEMERKHIAALGLVEIHKTIGCVGNLVVDGIELLPEDPAYAEMLASQRKCQKLD